MSPRGWWPFRLVLRCYPKDFRRAYGDQMVQVCLDRHRLGGVPMWRVLVREIGDASLAATTMRLENPMTRIVWMAVAVAASIAAVLARGPALLAPLVVVGAGCAIAAARRSATGPIASSARWVRWVGGGAVLMLPGLVILLASDEELGELLWAGAAVSLLGGGALLLIGLLMALSPAPPSPVVDARP